MNQQQLEKLRKLGSWMNKMDIESLFAEIDRLREALSTLSTWPKSDRTYTEAYWEMIEYAQGVLDDKQD